MAPQAPLQHFRGGQAPEPDKPNGQTTLNLSLLNLRTVGNLTAMEKDVTRELLAGGRNIVGVHLKDTRVREFRRVPFGEGLVDFDAAFRTLNRMGYRGLLMVEMWNESEADPVATAAAARRWLAEKLDRAFGKDIAAEGR